MHESEHQEVDSAAKPAVEPTGLDPWLGQLEGETMGQRVRGPRGQASPAALRQLQRSAGNAAVRRLLEATAPPLARQPARDDRATEPSPLVPSEFLPRLESALVATAEQSLADTPWSAAGCPWIRHWIDYYSRRSPAEIEQAMVRYAPEAAAATTDEARIEAICARVREGITAWTRSRRLARPPAVPTLARTPNDSSARLGAGEPLPPTVAGPMSSALGGDLSGVRIHRDAAAAEAAARLGATAFTIGRHVAFGAGAYEPGTPVGDALIAHELAHVLQQDDGDTLARAPVGDAAELEHDADAAAVVAIGRIWMGERGPTGERRLGRRSRGLQLQRCGTVEGLSVGASWTMVAQEARLANADEEIDEIEQTLGPLRRQALDDNLISQRLFDAWNQAALDFIILRPQAAGGRVLDALRNNAITHVQAFFDALKAETDPEGRLGNALQSQNEYTGEAIGAYFIRSPAWDIITALRAGQWDQATHGFRTMVAGLDRWIARRNRERYGSPVAERVETNRANVGETLSARQRLLDQARPGALRVPAVLHVDYDEDAPDDTPADIPLSLYCWRDGDTWTIKDFTSPSDPYEWHVDAVGQETDPPDALFTELESGPHFPPGSIRYGIRQPDGTIGRRGEVQTTGPSPVRRWLTYIGLGAAAIGLGLATFGAGTVAVVGGYILAGTAIMGGSIAAYDLYERSTHGTLTPGVAILDVAQIIAALTGLGALRAGQLISNAERAAASGAALRSSLALQWAGRYFVPLTMGNLATDTVILAVMTRDLAEQYDAIDERAGTDETRRHAKIRLLMQYALTLGLTALSVRGSIPGLVRGRSIRIERVNGVDYAIPVGPSSQGEVVNTSRGRATEGPAESVPGRTQAHLDTIRSRIQGDNGVVLAEVEGMALRPQTDGALRLDPTGNVMRGKAVVGTLEELVGKVTRANSTTAAYGVETEYVLRIRPSGGPADAVEVVAQRRTTPSAAEDVAPMVLRRFVTASSGRLQTMQAMAARVVRADPASTLEILPDGTFRLNNQIVIDAARLAEIGAGQRSVYNPARGSRVDVGIQDLHALLRGTRELDARGGDMVRLRQDLPAVAQALTDLTATGAYRLRLAIHADMGVTELGRLGLAGDFSTQMNELVGRAPGYERTRAWESMRDTAGLNADMRRLVAEAALSRRPRTLLEFVNHYEFLKAEVKGRLDTLEARAATRLAEAARAGRTLPRARGGTRPLTIQDTRTEVLQEELRALGIDPTGAGAPRTLEEVLGARLGTPAGRADLNMAETTALAEVSGRTGGAMLPAGAFDETTAQTVGRIRQAGPVPFGEETTAAYHVHKHTNEIPPSERYDPGRPASAQGGVGSRYDAMVESARRTIANGAASEVPTSTDQVGMGRRFFFERTVTENVGGVDRVFRLRAIVLVRFDGSAILLTYGSP
jgi:hypothetical protein